MEELLSYYAAVWKRGVRRVCRELVLLSFIACYVLYLLIACDVIDLGGTRSFGNTATASILFGIPAGFILWVIYRFARFLIGY